MKSGIFVTFALDGGEARKTLAHLSELGYDCADLQTFVNTETEWFDLPSAERLRRWEDVGKAARDCGVSFSQTHGPWRYPPRDSTEEERAERFDKMAVALEGTAAVGAPCMAIHNIMPFGVDVPPDPARFMDMNREFFSRLLEKAKAAGVVIALENMPFKNLPLSTPEQVLNFAKEFDSPFFRICLDTGHAAVFGLSPADAVKAGRDNIKSVFAVGVPSAVLVGLFDLASVCVNIIAAAHSDLVLAGMGIVMKVERIPNAVNIGICQGMLPIVAYNYASGDHARMKAVIHAARVVGLVVAALSIACLEIFAEPFCRFFLNANAGDASTALTTIGFAVLFLRIRCVASPVQFTNYHASYCMQAMGKGKKTLLHAFVRELVFYIPFMFILDRLFGEVGLAAALPVGESCGAAFALFLLHRAIKEAHLEREGI